MPNKNLGVQFSEINRDPTRRTVVRRLRNIYEATPDELRESGLNWYADVHDAARKSAKEHGRSVRQAAGVVAAVSPNMDWDSNNIHAFSEMASLSPKDLHIIRESAATGKRTDAAREVLASRTTPDRLMSIATAPDANILKAHRIWNEGVDPEEVLRRQGAPKTNSFFRNILSPHVSGDVTVDGRHADLIADAMRPWSGKGSGRGISSAETKTGKVTRYEEYEEHTRALAKHLGILPHQLQAAVWVGAKPIERGFDPQRKQGDARTGQSYQRRLKEFQSGLG